MNSGHLELDSTLFSSFLMRLIFVFKTLTHCLLLQEAFPDYPPHASLMPLLSLPVVLVTLPHNFLLKQLYRVRLNGLPR